MPLAKANSLDSIILKTTTNHRASSPCFGLMESYRSNPAKYDISPIPQPIRGVGQSRLARNWSPPPVAELLAKSASMPDLKLDAEGEPTADAPAEEEDARNVWVCKGCQTEDVGRLTRNADGGFSCVCGTVAELVGMVAQERSKNCPKAEDRTQVGEAQAQSATQAAYLAVRNGSESAEDRKRRQHAQAGGSRLSTKCAQKNDVLQAQNCLESRAVRDAMELCREDAPDQGRGAKVVGQLELLFEKLPALKHGEVKAHIRLETIRIYRLSQRHEMVCRNKACMYALKDHSVGSLAMSIAELVVSQLAGYEPSARPVCLAKLSGGTCSQQDMQKAMLQLQQVLQKRSSGGHVQRLKVLSAVSLISAWEEEDEVCTPCVNESTAMPPICSVPTALANCPGEFGKCSSLDPGDITAKLLRSLVAVVSAMPTLTKVRVAARYQLEEPALVQFLQGENFPPDVAAIAILSATATKMGEDDPTTKLRGGELRRYQIAASTFDALVAQVSSYTKIPDPEDENNYLFG